MGAFDGEHVQLLKIYHDGDDARPPADAARKAADAERPPAELTMAVFKLEIE